MPVRATVAAVLAAAAALPAGAQAAGFPSLKAAAGTNHRAQRVEQRVRRIEIGLLGRGHAAEHARQRVLAHRAARVTRQAATPLAPDNSLVPPAVGGAWAPSVPLPAIAINAALLHTGKVLYFAYPWRPGRPDPDNPGQTLPDSEQAVAYVFDPATGQSKEVDPPINPDTGKPAIIFCAGTSTLPDGRILVVGGDVGDPTVQPNQGADTVYTFDPDTETWQTFARTRQGRWYPTQLEMGDGRTVIMAGMPKQSDPDWSIATNADVEIFSPDGTMQRLQSFRTDGTGYNPTYLGQYPHLFWMPDGHALIAGPRKTDTWRFLPPTPGQDDAGSQDMPDLPTFREWAAGALLPGSAKVMLFGGSDKDDRYVGSQNVWPATTSTTVFDDRNPTLGWQPGADMNAPRSFANSVLLPDGRIAVVGGGVGETNNILYRWQYTAAQLRVDLYDPAANTFTYGNAQAEGRTYHSTALLLPDGRVMSAGDDINGPTGPDSGVKTDTAEMWSPPYLFNADGTAATRPVIDSAPASIDYGKPFLVGTSGAVSRAVLVAPGAVTHDNDMSQRVVPLATPVAGDGGITLQAPASGNEAPPGYYMLFVLDANGTPSVARFVLLRDEPDATPTPTPTPTVTVSPTPTPVPALRLRLAARAPRLAVLRRTRRLSVALTVSTPATVRLFSTLERHGAFATTRVLQLGTGRRTLVLRPTPAARRRLAKLHRVTLRLGATGRPRAGGPAQRAVLRLRLR